MKKTFQSYRIYRSGSKVAIIKVYSDAKGKIVSYSDYVLPTANSTYDLKILLSTMLKAFRNDVLTDEDLKGCIQKK